MTALDFSDLPPDSAPGKDAITSAIADAEQVSVAGPVSALAAVLTALNRMERLDLRVAWIPTTDPLAAGLSRSWGLDSDGCLSGKSPRSLGLVRDDHGGVLLARGRVTSVPRETGKRGPAQSRFGAQIYHDDHRVADGQITRVDVRPDWNLQDRLTVNVHKQLWRRGEITQGRAIQIACDEAQIESDGVLFPRPITKWTWYADPRYRWMLITT